jgi:DNA-binding MarR family transcriptional regulator
MPRKPGAIDTAPYTYLVSELRADNALALQSHESFADNQVERTSASMTQPHLFEVLLAAIVIAGVLGGLLNFYQTRRADDEDSSLWKSITLGIGASFLVPLFLNTISSSLVSNIQTKPEITQNMLVFFGFCLVAAISSKAFIQTMSKRVLNEAREAKEAATAANEKASEVESALEPILEKETEPQPESDAAEIVATLPTLDDEEWKLLEALANGEKVLRTRTGLARQTGIPKSEVNRIMDALRDRNLVSSKEMKKSDGSKITRWYITTAGRNIVVAHSAATGN